MTILSVDCSGHITKLLALVVTLMGTYAECDVMKSCHDGDTCRFVSARGKVRKVRLAGLDAPEIDEPAGKAARDKLISSLKGKEATLVCNGKSHDRVTCQVLVEGKDVGFEMVSSGFAWDLPTFSNGKYRNAQAEAENAKRGLWSANNVKSPFCQRELQKRNGNQRCELNPKFIPR